MISPPPPAITAVVLTLNEARHLPDCLDSLTWADARLVLDSGSGDGTQAIAQDRGAAVVHHLFQNYSRQRQRALELVTTPWLLFVDADERVSPALADAIRSAIASGAPGAPAGYWIARRNTVWGQALRASGWWPDHQLRLLRADRARYDPERAVHEEAIVDGPLGRIDEPLVHLNYDSWGEFRAKQLAYARMEAGRRRRAGQRVRPHNLVLQPLREFRRRIWTEKGFRDGLLGLQLAVAMAWYELRTLWWVRAGLPRAS